MSSLVANTVMLTTKCSGGCSHCPFSNSKLEQLFLPPETVTRILHQSTAKLAILSGGEPFEHPEIAEIINSLSEITTPFRIATGGFIKLDPWIFQIQNLKNSSFKGISMGTDVLSNRIDHSDWVPIWENNVHLLIRARLPFSVTLTISPEFQLDRLDFFSWKELFKCLPEFIYLRHSDDCLRDLWIDKIQEAFDKIPIIVDNISSCGQD